MRLFQSIGIGFVNVCCIYIKYSADVGRRVNFLLIQRLANGSQSYPIRQFRQSLEKIASRHVEPVVYHTGGPIGWPEPIIFSRRVLSLHAA